MISEEQKETMIEQFVEAATKKFGEDSPAVKDALAMKGLDFHKFMLAYAKYIEKHKVEMEWDSEGNAIIHYA